MPWVITVDFADSRDRIEERVPGDVGLAMAIENVLYRHELRTARSTDLIEGKRTGGYQITARPCA